jgi:putative oxidoreductase
MSTDDQVIRLLQSRYESGAAAVLVALLRAAAGFVFVTFGLGKFVDHASEVVDFRHYGIPMPDAAVWLTGTIEVLCGLLLVVGLLTRPAAALPALTLVGAISTAGRVDGGSFHLGVGPTLLAVMLVLLWLGPGRPSIDAVLERRAPRRTDDAEPVGQPLT